jgi:hypothetical protein
VTEELRSTGPPSWEPAVEWTQALRRFGPAFLVGALVGLRRRRKSSPLRFDCVGTSIGLPRSPRPILDTMAARCLACL